MKRWFPSVSQAGSEGDKDLLKAADAAGAYIDEYELARKDLHFSFRIETMASRIPGLAEDRFAQLQDIEAILEYIEEREKRAMAGKIMHYTEHYQRTVSERLARDYASASDEVQLIRSVLQQVAYVRNLYLGIMKGFEYMHFQITNVTKLRCAGLEDAEIQPPRGK